MATQFHEVLIQYFTNIQCQTPGSWRVIATTNEPNGYLRHRRWQPKKGSHQRGQEKLNKGTDITTTKTHIKTTEPKFPTLDVLMNPKVTDSYCKIV